MRKAIAALTVIGALGMPAAASAANQRPYPKLPTNVAHPGSAIVAFNTPIQASGDQFAATAGTQAASSDIAALNSTLASLKATPLLELGMRLGEGTGAVLAIPIVRAAAHLFTDVAALEDVLAGKI